MVFVTNVNIKLIKMHLKLHGDYKCIINDVSSFRFSHLHPGHQQVNAAEVTCWSSSRPVSRPHTRTRTAAFETATLYRHHSHGHCCWCDSLGICCPAEGPLAVLVQMPLLPPVHLPIDVARRWDSTQKASEPQTNCPKTPLNEGLGPERGPSGPKSHLDVGRPAGLSC